MSTAPTTICIAHDEGSPRKVTKIVPYGKGGFGLLAPYHHERRGFLARFPVDYAESHGLTSIELFEPYVAENRVKLSYHANGFVQFSGENPGTIVSGRDEAGRPRGLAVMTQPLWDPIITGPSCGLTVWGLGDFEELRLNRRLSGSLEIFSEGDFNYKRSTPETWTGLQR